LVRLAKLLRWLLEEVGKERPELFFIALRATGESVVNFRYLVQNLSPELIESYIQQSLQTDLKLEQTIEKNIAERGGEVWPIERRMLRSIQRDVERSGISRDRVPEKRIRHFGGKSLRDKADAVGLGDLYPAVFGGPSRMVHGGWKDLTMHHLEWVGNDRFQPRHETWRPSIQPLHAVGIIVTEALEEFFDEFDSPEVERLTGRATDLNKRLAMANELHEEFLVRRQTERENTGEANGDVS
jgi:hypothetical protein